LRWSRRFSISSFNACFDRHIHVELFGDIAVSTAISALALISAWTIIRHRGAALRP
jgi:hypothetical protein